MCAIKNVWRPLHQTMPVISLTNSNCLKKSKRTVMPALCSSLFLMRQYKGAIRCYSWQQRFLMQFPALALYLMGIKEPTCQYPTEVIRITTWCSASLTVRKLPLFYKLTHQIPKQMSILLLRSDLVQISCFSGAYYTNYTSRTLHFSPISRSIIMFQLLTKCSTTDE